MNIPKTNFRQWFEEKVDLGKDLPCIWFKDEMYTYGQVDASVNKVANALYDLGVRKGTKVAIVMTNRPEFLYCWFGLAKLGAISLFVNVDFKDDSLQYLLDHADAEFIIINNDRWDNYAQISKSLPKIKCAICMPDSKGIDSKQAIGFNRLLQGASSAAIPLIEIDNGEPMGFIHTAGTTGAPKWAMLSHKAYLTSGEYLREWSMTNYTDISFDPLPLFHINPQTYFLMSTLAGNGSVVIVEKYSASQFWKQVLKYKATLLVLHSAPIIYQLARPVAPEETQHRVRMIPVAGVRVVMERFKIPVGGSGYGSTELPGFVVMHKHYLPIPKKMDHFGIMLTKFCGKPVDYVEVRVVDENDKEKAVNELGEIIVRGKEPHVIFDGYYNMPDKNKQAFRNGWFHTGDGGRFDEEGNLIFEQRLADSINVKGEWIPVEIVEAACIQNPKVAEMALIAVQVDNMTETKAIVRLHEGQRMSHEELLDYLQTKLARFMIPRFVEFVAEFPRTKGTEKIQKEVLRKEGIGKAWDREASGYKLQK